jgi:hypothetical protein
LVPPLKSVDWMGASGLAAYWPICARSDRCWP